MKYVYKKISNIDKSCCNDKLYENLGCECKIKNNSNCCCNNTIYGVIGPTGPIGPTGATGTSGVLNYADFYALMFQIMQPQ